MLLLPPMVFGRTLRDVPSSFEPPRLFETIHTASDVRPKKTWRSGSAGPGVVERFVFKSSAYQWLEWHMYWYMYWIAIQDWYAWFYSGFISAIFAQTWYSHFSPMGCLVDHSAGVKRTIRRPVIQHWRPQLSPGTKAVINGRAQISTGLWRAAGTCKVHLGSRGGVDGATRGSFAGEQRWLE